MSRYSQQNVTLPDIPSVSLQTVIDVNEVAALATQNVMSKLFQWQTQKQ